LQTETFAMLRYLTSPKISFEDSEP
jgi:hypothetical protein